jgi:hypothetical protein
MSEQPKKTFRHWLLETAFLVTIAIGIWCALAWLGFRNVGDLVRPKERTSMSPAAKTQETKDSPFQVQSLAETSSVIAEWITSVISQWPAPAAASDEHQQTLTTEQISERIARVVFKESCQKIQSSATDLEKYCRQSESIAMDELNARSRTLEAALENLIRQLPDDPKLKNTFAADVASHNERVRLRIRAQEHLRTLRNEVASVELWHQNMK